MPTVLPLSELVYPVMKQTVKLLRFFINVLPHLKTSQSLRVLKKNNYEIPSCYSVHSFHRLGPLSSHSMMSEWSSGQNKMGPDWHAAPEAKRRICGGRRLSVGTTVRLRAPSLIKLQHGTSACFDKLGKICHFVTGAWPHGGRDYQNASVNGGVTSLRSGKRGGAVV